VVDGEVAPTPHLCDVLVPAVGLPGLAALCAV
jgi:hypothetical protein